jgi:hypothetical protein
MLVLEVMRAKSEYIAKTNSYPRVSVYVCSPDPTCCSWFFDYRHHLQSAAILSLTPQPTTTVTLPNLSIIPTMANRTASNPTRDIFRIGMRVAIRGGKYEGLFGIVNAITTTKLDVTINNRRGETVVQTLISQRNAEPIVPPPPPPPIISTGSVSVGVLLEAVEEFLHHGPNYTEMRSDSAMVTEEEWEEIIDHMSRMFIPGTTFRSYFS